MVKKSIIFGTIILVVITICIGIITVDASPSSLSIEIEGNNYQNNLTYDSNLFTGIDDLSLNEHKGSLIEDDKLICTSNNKKYELYFNEKLCIFKVKNTLTNYIYASAMDQIDDTSSNVYYGGFLSSSFSIEYYNYNTTKGEYDLNVLKAWTTKVSKLSASEKKKLLEENPDLKQFNFNISIAPSTEYSYEYLEDGIKVNIGFANSTLLSTDKSYSLGISINAYVTLDDEGLHVEIPNDEIVESGKIKLASIIVMPLLGGTYNNEVPGYMVIPDGSGALVRYGHIEKNNARQQKLDFYGNNIASEIQVEKEMLNSDKTLSLPIFGYVNGINQDGVYGIIEKGSRQASLTISPCGSLNINYNFMMPSFNKRYNYLLYGVNSTIIDELYNEDIKLTYCFLSNEEANYVGIALDYQQYLVNHHQLVKTSDGVFKTQIDFLMSETVAGAFGKKRITMTSLDSAKTMYSELKNAGLDNMIIVLKGWNNKGFTGSTPYNIKINTRIGSKKAFKDWFAKLENEGTSLYVYNDYLVGYNDGDVNKQKDLARNDLRLRMNFSNSTKPVFNNYFYLYPFSSKDKLEKNINTYQNLNISGLALNSIGNTLYSYYYKNKIHTREESYHYYDEALEEASNNLNIALYKPNEYMYKYLDDYLSMELYANNYIIYSDTVPLVPYVLKGYVDYYAEYANFNAIGIDQYLRMLDYGCFPSYILTNEISYNLKYTNSVNLYTTAYKDWKDTIIYYNNLFKDAYQKLTNSSVISREIIKIGVVKVTYQNNSTKLKTSVLINYNNNEHIVENIKINSKSFMIVGNSYA